MSEALSSAEGAAPVLYSDGVKRPFEGVQRQDFEQLPAIWELFPASGGGMPGLVYLLVATEHSAEYLGKIDDESPLAGVGDSRGAKWMAVRGRETPIMVGGKPVSVFARGVPLATRSQGDIECELFVDNRLAEALALLEPATALEPAVAAPPKAKTRAALPDK